MKTKLCALLALTFFVQNLHAQNEPTEIVITPYRSATNADQVGNSFSVIAKEEIEKKQASSVLEVLRSVPGLAIVQAGGKGRASSVFIRGADSDHTLVLTDGIRANESNVGSFDFADIKTDNIERIEIIRGAQSVLYGSEAIGGVINIITKEASAGTEVSGRISGGSYGTHSERLGINYGSEKVKQTASISFEDSDGISAADKDRGNPEEDSYENLTLSTNTQFELSDETSASLSLRYTDAETELDGFEFGTGAVDDPNALQERQALAVSGKVSTEISGSINSSLEIGTYREDLEGSDPDTEFNNFDIESSSFSLTPKVDIELNENNVSTLGYTFEERQGENQGNFDEKRQANSFFAQHSFSHNESLFLTAGIRQEHDSEFGEETTYKVTLAKLLNDSGTRFHSSFATGFKAPSFNELYFPFFGNPDLKPETSIGYDFGVEQKFYDDKAIFDLTFFQNEFDDLIAFDTGTFQAENISESSAYGFETSLDFEICESLNLITNYTYTKSKDESTGELLPRRPRHQGSINLDFQASEKLAALLSFYLVNNRIESTGEKMDNYERVDLSLNYQLSKNIKPFIHFENLFDEDYEEIVGFGTAGFSVYAGLEIKL